MNEDIMQKIAQDLSTYERSSEYYLMRNVPIIVRIDGKNFKHLTRSLEKPFSSVLNEIMKDTLISLCRTIKGVVMGYAISDEFDLLIYDTEDYWYNNNLQGLVASIASLVTGIFNKNYSNKIAITDSNKRVALFDVVAFNVPCEHVSDYFIKKQNYEMRAALEYACEVRGIYRGVQDYSDFDLKRELLDERNVNYDKDYSVFNRLGMVVVENDSGDYVIEKDTPLFEMNLSFFNELLDVPFYNIVLDDDENE